MKTFTQLLNEQKAEVKQLRQITEKLNEEKIVANRQITAALLCGSLARGDARSGPFGLMIDITLIVENKQLINLTDIFGKDEEPFIPYHCIKIDEKHGFAFEVIEVKELLKIREQSESTIFAKKESIILKDSKDFLKNWKLECFTISSEEIRKRSLRNYFRFCYLTDEYRFEKWNSRDAYCQISQNMNEAAECYCNFIYCINKEFIPRKDWLVYLSFEQKITPNQHKEFINKLYTSNLNKKDISKKNNTIKTIQEWMRNYCEQLKWL